MSANILECCFVERKASQPMCVAPLYCYCMMGCRANRPRSYISRTTAWDEFPRGRWGDTRNPAYGSFNDHQVCSFSGDIALLDCTSSYPLCQQAYDGWESQHTWVVWIIVEDKYLCLPLYHFSWSPRAVLHETNHARYLSLWCT